MAAMEAINASSVETTMQFDLPTTVAPYDKIQGFALAVVTSVISLLGIPGNAVIIAAVCLSPKLRTSTNAFIANLAFSDFVTCLALPVNTFALLADEPPNEFICSVVAAVTYVMVGASIANLALIAYNRFYLITRCRTKYDLLYSRRNTVLMIILSWLYIILIICLPPALDYGKFGYSKRFHVCTTDEEHPFDRQNDILRGMMIQFLFFVVVVVCYLLILIHVRKSSRALVQGAKQNCPRESNQADNLNHQLKKRQIEVTKNLFIIVCAHILCVLPFGIVNLFDCCDDLNRWVTMFLLANSCMNPFIYGLNHPQFKRVFQSICRCNLRNVEQPLSLTGNRGPSHLRSGNSNSGTTLT